VIEVKGPLVEDRFWTLVAWTKGCYVEKDAEKAGAAVLVAQSKTAVPCETPGSGDTEDTRFRS